MLARAGWLHESVVTYAPATRTDRNTLNPPCMGSE